VIAFSRSDLEKWLTNPITKALISDMQERRAHYIKELAERPFTTPKSIAYGNKLQGMVENVDFFLAFPTLILQDILEEELKKNEEEGNDTGK
jgi:hypothetical protein